MGVYPVLPKWKEGLLGRIDDGGKTRSFTPQYACISRCDSHILLYAKPQEWLVVCLRETMLTLCHATVPTYMYYAIYVAGCIHFYDLDYYCLMLLHMMIQMIEHFSMHVNTFEKKNFEIEADKNCIKF